MSPKIPIFTENYLIFVTKRPFLFLINFVTKRPLLFKCLNHMYVTLYKASRAKRVPPEYISTPFSPSQRLFLAL